ncbi:hypothetical protein [Croceicoccus bisphenolivorans]|uniref:hypothetical protein n=1 Tax=Croceicoccus bisphenolivorans TaxID=1783232 RepID=UPI00156101A8|nr:hypothetical protein [Croceicoccus bisphenolivorans]
MKKLSPAASTLVLGGVLALALWLLGETTAAIAILVAEAIGWAVLYAFAADEKED